MNRRAFLQRIGLVAGAIVAAPAVAQIGCGEQAAITAATGMSYRGIPIVTDNNMPYGHVILTHKKTADAYEALLAADYRFTMADIERSGDAFWRSQR